jgi:Holliday junction resolvase RusA-like endonuclease
MNTFAISLPMPPSGNNLFFNYHKGRRISDGYLSWMSKCNEIIDALPFKTNGLFSGRIVRIDLKYGCPIRARDNDNLCKPVHDYLVKSEIIDDDNCFVVPITHQEYCPTMPANSLLVTVTEIIDNEKYRRRKKTKSKTNIARGQCF